MAEERRHLAHECRRRAAEARQRAGLTGTKPDERADLIEVGISSIWLYARAGWKSNMINSHGDLLERVQALTWVHSIDLGNGIVTPGMWGPPSPTIMRALDTIDFHGKKVLDIGCWDGLWSFEAEKRGATTIVATDLNTQRWPPDGHLTFMRWARRRSTARMCLYTTYRAPSPSAISTSCSSAGYTTICAIHYLLCRGFDKR